MLILNNTNFFERLSAHHGHLRLEANAEAPRALVLHGSALLP